MSKLKTLMKRPRTELATMAWKQLWPRRFHPHTAETEAGRRFRRDGLLVLPNLIPSEDIAEANACFDRALSNGKNATTGEAVFEKPKGVKNIPSILADSPIFRKLMHHPRLLPHLEDTIGCRAKMFHPQALVYPPNVQFFNNWHSDLHNRMPWIDLSTSTLFVKAIFYLTDVTRNGGAFTYIRGSHRYAPRRSFSYLYDGLLRRHKTQIVEGKAGTVVLFHTSGFHRVQPNITRERRTLTYSYTHFWVRNNFENPQLNGIDPNALSETERHMLGYRIGGQASYDQVCPAFRQNGDDSPAYDA